MKPETTIQRLNRLEKTEVHKIAGDEKLTEYLALTFRRMNEIFYGEFAALPDNRLEASYDFLRGKAFLANQLELHFSNFKELTEEIYANEEEIQTGNTNSYSAQGGRNQ
jgi:hypothetical protein